MSEKTHILAHEFHNGMDNIIEVLKGATEGVAEKDVSYIVSTLADRHIVGKRPTAQYETNDGPPPKAISIEELRSGMATIVAEEPPAGSTCEQIQAAANMILRQLELPVLDRAWVRTTTGAGGVSTTNVQYR